MSWQSVAIIVGLVWMLGHARGDEPVRPKAGERVLFFGDSITFDGAYGRMVQEGQAKRDPQCQMVFAARGKHGDTAQGSLQRVQSQLVPWKPDWVFVNLGINDMGRYEPDEFLQHYEALLDAIADATGARLAVISPIFPDRDEPNPRLVAYVEALRRWSKLRGHLYVPVYETMSWVRSQLPLGVAYAPDGIHPNALGDAIIASAILDAIGFPAGEEPVTLEIPEDRLKRTRGKAVSLAVPIEFTLPLATPLRVVSIPTQRQRVAIPRRTQPVVLDGDLAEWEQGMPSFQLREPEHLIVGIPSTENPSPEVDVWLATDEEALYFAVQVRDDKVRHEEGAGILQRDGVELFLDVRPEPQEPTVYNAKTVGVVQFMLGARSRLDSPVEVGNGDVALAVGAQVATRETPGGYTMEFRFPLKHFPDGRIPEHFGLDLSVNDLDDSDIYVSVIQLRWSGSGQSSFHTRSWGRAAPEPTGDAATLEAGGR